MGPERPGRAQSLEMMTELIEEERKFADAYRRRASAVSDPGLRRILGQIAEIHAACCAGLQGHWSEMCSQAEITRQITDLYR